MSKTVFPRIDKELLVKWSDEHTFDLSVNKNNVREYVFLDGPPFANGLPHYGHLLTGFLKDTYTRYHTMKGEKVERRCGWDCHGLPAEMSVEKTLINNDTKLNDDRKFTGGKENIKNLKKNCFDSIEYFNNLCKQDVTKYTYKWKEYIEKQGRWVNFDDGYKTLDLSYMESVIWVFNELYKKGLIYEDYRVMPYSWKCQTPVSNFETKMDNAYRQHESKSVYLKFRLKKNPNFLQKAFPNCKSTFLLVWTTTPWTLPSNLALAVNSEIQYSAFEYSDEIYICAVSQKDKIRQMFKLDKQS